MAIRGLLFDKDGTLIDFDGTWSPVLRRIAEELHPEAETQALLEAAGLDSATGRFRSGSVGGAGSTPDLVALWWPEAEVGAAEETVRRIDAVCAEMAPHASVPLVDLAAYFDALAQRGFVVGIATNDSSASLNAFLRHHQLTEHVPHAFGYDSVAQSKPAPDMVHAFCQAAKLAPAEVAVIGDNVHDLEMARAAGAGAVVAVLSGNGGRGDLEPLADLVIDGIADLAVALETFTSGAGRDDVL